jgi:hypothetical protein
MKYSNKTQKYSLIINNLYGREKCNEISKYNKIFKKVIKRKIENFTFLKKSF